MAGPRTRDGGVLVAYACLCSVAAPRQGARSQASLWLAPAAVVRSPVCRRTGGHTPITGRLGPCLSPVLTAEHCSRHAETPGILMALAASLGQFSTSSRTSRFAAANKRCPRSNRPEDATRPPPVWQSAHTSTRAPILSGYWSVSS